MKDHWTEIKEYNDLPEQIKDIMYLREVERRPFKWIGDKLGITPSYANAEYLNAHRKIKLRGNIAYFDNLH